MGTVQFVVNISIVSHCSIICRRVRFFKYKLVLMVEANLMHMLLPDNIGTSSLLFFPLLQKGFTINAKMFVNSFVKTGLCVLLVVQRIQSRKILRHCQLCHAQYSKILQHLRYYGAPRTRYYLQKNQVDMLIA